MKRRDLIILLERNGWKIAREGSCHTIYAKGNLIEPIPRHNEIDERLARAIIKKHNLKEV